VAWNFCFRIVHIGSVSLSRATLGSYSGGSSHDAVEDHAMRHPNTRDTARSEVKIEVFLKFTHVQVRREGPRRNRIL